MTVEAASLLAEADERQRARSVSGAVGGTPVTSRLASLSFSSSGENTNGNTEQQGASENECPPGWTVVESEDGARRYWNKLTGEISAAQPTWAGPQISPRRRVRTGTATQVAWPTQSSLDVVAEDDDEDDAGLASPSF